MLIIFCFLFLILGIVCSYGFIYYKVITMLLLIITLIIFFLFTDKRKLMMLYLAFLFLGFVSFRLYFNCSVKYPIEVRITNIKDEYSIGTLKGRKVYIFGKNDGLDVGDKILINKKDDGKFSEFKIYNKGVIGNINLKKFSKEPKDSIFYINNIKVKFYNNIKKYLGAKQAGIILSLCFGDTSYIESDYMKSLQDLGVVHVISVSGFHMALVFTLLSKILNLYCCIFLCFLYLLVTGVTAPTVRAFVMIITLKLCKKVMRNYNAIASLCLSGILVLTFKPYSILSMSFLLSYLACLGIIIYYDKIKRKLWRMKEFFSKSLALTISASIFTVPILSYFSIDFSILSFISNLFLVPIYSAIVILGLILCLFSWNGIISNMLSYILKIIFTIEEGGKYIILLTGEKYLRLNKYNFFLFMVMFISYHLYKRGFKPAKKMPLIMVFIIFINIYYPIPFVNKVKLPYGEAVIISYKYDKILLLDYDIIKFKDVYKLKSSMCPTMVITSNEGINYKFKFYNITFNKKRGYEVFYKDVNIPLLKNQKYFLIGDKKIKIP